MVNPLAPWGIDPRAEDLYRQLLRLPGISNEELIKQHGWKADDLEASMRALVRARLVRAVQGTHSPVSPIMAIDELVIAEEVRLTSRVQQLEEARSALRSYASEYRVAPSTELPAAEIISFGHWDDAVLQNLIAAADGPLRVVYSRFLNEPAARLTQLSKVIQLGYPMQVLLPSILLGNENIMPILQGLQSVNAQIRLGTDAKSSFTIFGTMAASSLTDPEDFRSDRLVVRVPTLINIMTSYFESIWQHALPLNAQEVDEATRVIALLGEGLKDESIARQLDISLRTVRRRIADFMDEIGAETRFQAGVEAQRRGLI